VDGGFNGGEDTIFDVASGAVGIGVISPTVPQMDVAEVKRVQEEIASGQISDIPTTVKG
jgi:DNA primase